jgi:hypothetical protein
MKCCTADPGSPNSQRYFWAIPGLRHGGSRVNALMRAVPCPGKGGFYPFQIAGDFLAGRPSPGHPSGRIFAALGGDSRHRRAPLTSLR